MSAYLLNTEKSLDKQITVYVEICEIPLRGSEIWWWTLLSMYQQNLSVSESSLGRLWKAVTMKGP